MAKNVINALDLCKGGINEELQLGIMQFKFFPLGKYTVLVKAIMHDKAYLMEISHIDYCKWGIKNILINWFCGDTPESIEILNVKL